MVGCELWKDLGNVGDLGRLGVDGVEADELADQRGHGSIGDKGEEGVAPGAQEERVAEQADQFRLLGGREAALERKILIEDRATVAVLVEIALEYERVR